MAGPIRQPICVRSLETYLSTAAPHIRLPLTVQQFGYGQSNPTYLLTCAAPTSARYVLRKKPPGQLLSKTAHQVEREYRVLKALAGTAVPAPKVYCLCEDLAVLGSAFYVMEYLDGRIFDDPSLPGVTPESRAAMWTSALTTLATLHLIPPASNELLRGFGRPNGFYNRQIKTLSAIEVAQAVVADVDTGVPVGKIPRFDEMMRYFSATQPDDRSAVVHGDYKIDNLVFHKTEPRVIGILDWELSTIGHPLSDLSNLLSPYQLATADAAGASFVGGDPAAFLDGATPGLPTRAEAIACYSRAASWDIPPSHVFWGDAFGFVRNSVIVQGVAARYAMRQASSENAGVYAERIPMIAAIAWKHVEMSERERKKEERAGGKL